MACMEAGFLIRILEQTGGSFPPIMVIFSHLYGTYFLLVGSDSIGRFIS